MLRVELLDATHDRSGFACGVEPLNRSLQQIARQHLAKGISKTFVLVDEDAAAPKPVLGFFTISLCQVLGRLAVAQAQQGAGYGKALLVEALHRIARVAELAGGIGLFVDAKDEAAAREAISHGESKAKAGLAPAEVAAYSLVANMILNLDETVTRN